MSYIETASATNYAYAKDGSTTGSLVTSSATASASSDISESDAYDKALNIANSIAQSVADNNANIIDQAVEIVQHYSPVTFGINAGYTGQGTHSIAIGDEAGYNNQGTSSVAIGYSAGYTGQKTNSVAVGNNAGSIGQSQYSVALGSGAGYSSQGPYSIAIGNDAGSFNQSSNSIILNAMNTGLNTGASGFYVKPINSGTNNMNSLFYNTNTGQITYYNGASKTFVIDHPTDESKYLVHACLEGPEAGVYYRGEGTISNNHSVEISLPDYVDKLANNFSVQITPIYNPNITKPLLTSRVVNNKFTVYGENSDFFWSVYGKRSSIEVEPSKTSVDVKGSGPYLWI